MLRMLRTSDGEVSVPASCPPTTGRSVPDASVPGCHTSQEKAQHRRDLHGQGQYACDAGANRTHAQHADGRLTDPDLVAARDVLIDEREGATCRRRGTERGPPQCSHGDDEATEGVDGNAGESDAGTSELLVCSFGVKLHWETTSARPTRTRTTVKANPRRESTTRTACVSSTTWDCEKASKGLTQIGK